MKAGADYKYVYSNLYSESLYKKQMRAYFTSKIKVNELGFKPFLDTPVNSFIIGLKDFCINQNYFKSINKLN